MWTPWRDPARSGGLSWARVVRETGVNARRPNECREAVRRVCLSSRPRAPSLHHSLLFLFSRLAVAAGWLRDAGRRAAVPDPRRRRAPPCRLETWARKSPITPFLSVASRRVTTELHDSQPGCWAPWGKGEPQKCPQARGEGVGGVEERPSLPRCQARSSARELQPPTLHGTLSRLACYMQSPNSGESCTSPVGMPPASLGTLALHAAPLALGRVLVRLFHQVCCRTVSGVWRGCMTESRGPWRRAVGAPPPAATGGGSRCNPPVPSHARRRPWRCSGTSCRTPGTTSARSSAPLPARTQGL